MSMHKQAGLLILFVIIVFGFWYALHSQIRVLQKGVQSQAVIVNDASLPITFTYPASWGQWTVGNSEVSFSGFENSDNNIRITLRKYDDGTNRYERVCETYGDESCRDVDILEEKQVLVKSAKQSIAGVPATIHDYFYNPSGALVREIQFYTPAYRVNIIAAYPPYSFFDARGARDSSNSKSSTEIVQGLLGPEAGDPIYRLSAMYPQELKDMINFYGDFDQFVASIKIL